MSPYQGADFFLFFKILFIRFWSGAIFFPPFYIDELQIAVLSGLALSGALVGTFLILKKMATFANAVSHTVLLGLAVAFFFSHSTFQLTTIALLVSALVTALFTGFLVRVLVDYFKIQVDASIAFVFCFLFSLGLVVLVFLTDNTHIGIDLIMGNPDILTLEDVGQVWSAFVLNAMLFSIFFRGFVVVSFDPSMAQLNGFPNSFLNHLIMFQTSLNLIISFKATGVLMALSFLIFPQIISKIFVDSVKQMMVYSGFFGLLVSFLAPALSRHFLTTMNTGLSTAGLTVILLFFLYIVLFICKSFKRKHRNMSVAGF